MPEHPFKMFISEATASQRHTNFIGLKHKLLSHIINKNEAEYIFLNTTQLTELINLLESCMRKDSGLRIYFATYKKLPATDDAAKTNNALIPEASEDLLTLIFAPTIWTGKDSGNHESHRDTGDYFVLDPTTGKFVNLKNIDPSIFRRWTKYYEELKCKFLSNHFNIEETKSMWYEYEKIENFGNYLSNTNNNIQGVKIRFASYHDNEEASVELNNGKTKSYPVSNKLTLTFSLETNTNSFKEEGNSLSLSKAQSLHGDTGVPCPPGVCK